MLRPILLKFFQKTVVFIFILTVSIGTVNGQVKTTGKQTTPRAKPAAKKNNAKPKPLAPGKPNVSITIDTASFNIVTPDKAVDGDQITDISLEFLVAGNTPTADVKVTLSLEDRTTATHPQFDEDFSPSNSFSITVPKTKFQGVGIINTYKHMVRLVYKKTAFEKGVAYITTTDKPNIFTKISFIAPQNVNRIIELLDSTTKVQLDTFQMGKKIEPSVKLYFLLKKAVGKDTTVQIIPNSDLKNVSLADDGTRQPSYTINFDKKDWNSNKDTIVCKIKSIYIKPLTPIDSTKDLLLKINGTGIAGHIVELIPSKVIAKNTLTNPVDFDDVEMASTTVGIAHYAGANVNTIDSILIKIKLKGLYNPQKNQIDFLVFDVDSTPSKHFQILRMPITLKKDDYENAAGHAGILTFPIYIKTVGLNDSANNVHYINLVLKGKKNSTAPTQRIKITRKEHPFWAEIGTNFDLLDNIKTTNLYVGVFGHLKDITGIGKDKKNLSFTGGMYESQSVTLSSSSGSGFNYRDGGSVTPNSNFPKTPYQYYTDTGRIKGTTIVKSIGLFFSPQIRITTTPTEESGIHLYLSIYSELLWQRVTASLDYSKTAISNTYHSGTLDSLTQNVPFKESEFDLDYRSHYIGFGFPIYIKENDFTMYVNTVYGIANQRFVLVDNSEPLNQNQYNSTVQNINPAYTNNNDGMSLINFAQPKSRWNSFYLIQYRLTEIKYGITLAGEVRGLTLNGSKPVITLALSKKFALSSLLKPIVAPF